MNMEPAVPKFKGLLSRASEISKDCAPTATVIREDGAKNVFLAFHQFALDFEVKKAGVFSGTKAFFALTVSHGLDLETVQRPETPSDFWQTVCFSKQDKNDWVTLSKEEMRAFLPLFSQSEQAEIDFISLKVFEIDEKQLILCFFGTQNSFFPENSSEFSAAFEEIAPAIAKSGLSGFSLSRPPLIQTQISSALENDYCANMFTLDFVKIFSELPLQITIQDRRILHNSLFNTLSHVAGVHNICISPSENIFKLVIFTQIPLKLSAFYSLLYYILQTFFDEKQLSLLKIDEGIPAVTEAEISAFLQWKV